MTAAITLSLNGIDIDWGQGRYWKQHHWLFPPGSLAEIKYSYAEGITETKTGFEASLREATFRLRHLGYSKNETKAKFERAVDRWNRTARLSISFADFEKVLTSLNFAVLDQSDLEPFIWDFRKFLVSLLSRWDTDDALLEDFIFSLDFMVTLSVLANRAENLDLMLRWHHQDLIDSGWVTFEDLTDIDRQAYIINHTSLVGRLQDYSGAYSIAAFDKWLVGEGLPSATPYAWLRGNGKVSNETTTLAVAVRNMIHHPENPHNTLTDEDLRCSVEQLLDVVKRLPTPLPGLQ